MLNRRKGEFKVLIIPYLIIIIYILFIKKNQRFTWLLVAMCIAMLSITSSFYPDLDNYVPLFDYFNQSDVTITLSTTNYLWALLCKIFYFLGFNYRGMVICLIFVDYYILHIAAKNLNCDERIFFGLFLIFPALIQLIQFKFFTSTSIVILAYSVLIKNKKHSILFFILLMCVAMLIHNSTVVFLIFLLLKFKNKKVSTKLILVITIFMSLIFSLNIGIVDDISRLLISEKQIDRYITNTISPSSVLWIIIIYTCWLLCYIISFYILKHSKKDNVEINQILTQDIIAINLLLLTIPLLLLDRNMHRFIEIGYVIMFFSVSIVMNKIEKRNNKDKLMLLFMICAILIFNTIIYTPFKSVIIPIFSYDGIVNIWR